MYSNWPAAVKLYEITSALTPLTFSHNFTVMLSEPARVFFFICCIERCGFRQPGARKYLWIGSIPMQAGNPSLPFQILVSIFLKLQHSLPTL